MEKAMDCNKREGQARTITLQGYLKISNNYMIKIQKSLKTL